MRFPQFQPGKHYLARSRNAVYAVHVISPFQVAVARFRLVDALPNVFDRGMTPVQQVYARYFDNPPWGLNEKGLSWFHLTNQPDIDDLGQFGEHMRYEEFGDIVSRARAMQVINFRHGVDGSIDI